MEGRGNYSLPIPLGKKRREGRTEGRKERRRYNCGKGRRVKKSRERITENESEVEIE